MSSTCQICTSAGPHTDFTVRELLLGMGGEFEYCECLSCGSVQIKSVPDPEVLSRSYPADYRSGQHVKANPISKWIRTERDRRKLGLYSLVGMMANSSKSDQIMPIFKSLKLPNDAAILDVGCGFGYILDRLHQVGFSNLLGCDPYMPDGFRTGDSISVLAIPLEKVSAKFDVIMFNHSLEHVTNFAETLSCARSKLNDGGICIIRIPTTSSYAWKEYRECWSQLDAPRHIVIPSRAGIDIVGERCGFKLEKTIDDSTGYFQFFASEAYRRGLSLDEASRSGMASKAQMRQFHKRAQTLNAAGQGDQAAFILRAA